MGKTSTKQRSMKDSTSFQSTLLFSFFCAVIALVIIFRTLNQTIDLTKSPTSIQALTWNMAAINNNPFGKLII